MDRSRSRFFTEAFSLRGSATLHVLPEIFAFGGLAAVTCLASWFFETRYGFRLKLEVGWFEVAGAAVSLLLVLRTNGGYDRWWEARKLWGGIVNQVRNLTIGAVAYGPADAEWRAQLAGWAAAFPYATIASLRGGSLSSRVAELVGPENCERLARAEHKPSFVALELAHLLRTACREHGMDRWAFAQLDRERALLIDHIGGCERILKSPLPIVYSIKVRRLIALFLATLPLVLLHKLSADGLVPIVTMLVAYPLISLDRIGYELQDPFSLDGLSPLPLEVITATIDRNVHGLARAPIVPAVDGDKSGELHRLRVSAGS